MEYEISITGLPKDMLFYALYKHARVARFFLLIDRQKYEDLSLRQILYIFQSSPDLKFEKVGEKYLFLDLSRDVVDPWRYDNQHHRGLFARVVDKMRNKFFDVDIIYANKKTANPKDNTSETKKGEIGQIGIQDVQPATISEASTGQSS